MIRVETLNLTDIRMRPRLEYFDAGYGPSVFENSAGAPPPPPPVITNGILQEAGTYFIMMEDGSSYILQEA